MHEALCTVIELLQSEGRFREALRSGLSPGA